LSDDCIPLYVSDKSMPPQLLSLVSPFTHSFAINEMRGLLIVSRVRQIAKLFAVLTICWIAADAFFLPWPLWGQLAIARALTGAAFLGLGMIDARPKLSSALLMLASVYGDIAISGV
jgi:hypothetical protein